jgi:hypothetical protein
MAILASPIPSGVCPTNLPIVSKELLRVLLLIICGSRSRDSYLASLALGNILHGRLIDALYRFFETQLL